MRASSDGALGPRSYRLVYGASIPVWERTMLSRTWPRAVSLAVFTLVVLSMKIVLAWPPIDDPESHAPPPTSQVPALRAQGLELGYNLDHADALAMFKSAIAADPTDAT